MVQQQTSGYNVMPAQTHIQSPGYPFPYNSSHEETLRFIMEAQRDSWIEVRVHDCGDSDPCAIRIFENPNGEGVTPYLIDRVSDSRMYIKKVNAKSRIVIDASMATIKRLWLSYQCKCRDLIVIRKSTVK